jgi:hypothetical protein
LAVKEKISMRQTLVFQLVVVAIVFVTAALTGCATTKSAMATRILEADEKVVSQCKYLGDVSGTSGWGNLAASTGINNAKNQAFERAAALGATHVVWTQISGGYSPFVNGRAYKCD